MFGKNLLPGSGSRMNSYGSRTLVSTKFRIKSLEITIPLTDRKQVLEDQALDVGVAQLNGLTQPEYQQCSKYFQSLGKTQK